MRAALPSCALVLLVACDPAPADMSAYLEATVSGSPTACGSIESSSLQGECQAFLARSLAKEGELEAAEATCSGIAHRVWHGECWFMVADAVDAVGQQGRELCAKAAPHRSQCRTHAMAREAGAIMEGRLPQEAGAVETELVEAMGSWLPPGRAADHARALLTKELAARDRDQPLGPDHCGGIDETLCAEVYDDRLRFHLASRDKREGKLALAEACRGPVDSATMEALGFPPWEPGVQASVELAWGGQCKP